MGKKCAARGKALRVMGLRKTSKGKQLSTPRIIQLNKKCSNLQTLLKLQQQQLRHQKQILGLELKHKYNGLKQDSACIKLDSLKSYGSKAHLNDKVERDRPTRWRESKLESEIQRERESEIQREKKRARGQTRES